MPKFYLRLGAFAEVHIGEAEFPISAGRRVIAQTQRGAEWGEIIGSCRGSAQLEGRPQATIVRQATAEDEYLIRRLERHKREAVELCREQLDQLGSSSILLDVEQLFDGSTLIMHFLGPIDAIAQAVTEEVVERYESVVRTQQIAKLLSDGCGPNCGSAGASGCSGNCSGCAIKCGV